MNVARRTATLLVVLTVLALASTGCGVKSTNGGNDAPGTTTETTAPADTTEPSEDTTEPSEDTTETTEGQTDTTEDQTDTTFPDIGESAKEDLVKLYTDMGLSEEQSRCLVDAFFDSATAGDLDPTDQSAIFDYLATCEIDITDFGGLGEGG